jgi:hypothetical protein
MSDVGDELGALSMAEIRKAILSDPEGNDAYSREGVERYVATENGKPGRHALLTIAQVRAWLEPLLEHPVDQYSWANAIHACARALLALPPDAPSPLDD